MQESFFTSESVLPGHPDKMADYVSDSILDYYLAKDCQARVAAETMLTNKTVLLAGEISSVVKFGDPSPIDVAKEALLRLGYIGDRDWETLAR